MNLLELLEKIEAWGKDNLGDNYRFCSVNISAISYNDEKKTVGVEYNTSVFGHDSTLIQANSRDYEQLEAILCLELEKKYAPTIFVDLP